MSAGHTLKYKVRETLRNPTQEPEGDQYNRMVVAYNGNNYEVSGTPYCFSGFSNKKIRSRCLQCIEAFVNIKKPNN